MPIRREDFLHISMAYQMPACCPAVTCHYDTFIAPNPDYGSCMACVDNSGQIFRKWLLTITFQQLDKISARIIASWKN
jgi:hypothetical protein